MWLQMDTHKQCSRKKTNSHQGFAESEVRRLSGDPVGTVASLRYAVSNRSRFQKHAKPTIANPDFDALPEIELSILLLAEVPSLLLAGQNAIVIMHVIRQWMLVG